MLFNYPSFINQTEQDESRLLFNNIRLALQTNIREIWYDVNYGTRIRDQIKNGITALVAADIQNDIEDRISKYFENDIKLNYMDIWQDLNKIKINLNYTELRTGKHNTIQAEEKFINSDMSLY